ncbi:MAG: serine hydrolase [Rhodothermales bacterium]|nr:serine hydrolase [Rhodothermales bacterium]MBO6779035.1 serine hydrolase [Rhodothermales bacterium]
MRRSLLSAALLLPLLACTQPVDTDALSADLDRIAQSRPEATVAVSIRDPHRGLDFDRNGDRLFHAASTMKVPVMIEVFRRVEEGAWSLDDSLVVRNSFSSIVDGSTYAIGDDSDDTIYGLLGRPMAVRELVTNMIVVSSNLATNLLIDELGAETVQATSEALGTTHMRTLRGVEDLKAFEQGLSNQATSEDLATLMLTLMEGHAVSRRADAEMVDILKAQEFNEMIPAGLPPDAQAAHKTGQITAIHHDAAIVYPEEGEPFVLVILIEGLADDTQSAELGAALTRAVYAHLRGDA